MHQKFILENLVPEINDFEMLSLYSHKLALSCVGNIKSFLNIKELRMVCPSQVLLARFT